MAESSSSPSYMPTLILLPKNGMGIRKRKILRAKPRRIVISLLIGWRMWWRVAKGVDDIELEVQVDPREM
jgi:hypothetical protein